MGVQGFWMTVYGGFGGGGGGGLGIRGLSDVLRVQGVYRFRI